ncbi:unnamed protein product [Arctogadus glacialis]
MGFEMRVSSRQPVANGDRDVQRPACLLEPATRSMTTQPDSQQQVGKVVRGATNQENQVLPHSHRVDMWLGGGDKTWTLCLYAAPLRTLRKSGVLWGQGSPVKEAPALPVFRLHLLPQQEELKRVRDPGTRRLTGQRDTQGHPEWLT